MNRFLFCLVLLGASSLGFDSQTVQWKKLSPVPSLEGRKLLKALANGSFLLGTEQGLFTMVNVQSSFRLAPHLTGPNDAVNDIYSDQSKELVATDRGVYLSQDVRHWQNIFLGAEHGARSCLSVLSDDKAIYVGTTEGLYIGEGIPTVWNGPLKGTERSFVQHLADDGNDLFYTTQTEVFRMDKRTKGLQKVFSLVNHETRENELGPATETQEDNSQPQSILKGLTIIHLTSDSRVVCRIYLLTTQGIFFSENNGQDWHDIASSGLPLNDVTSMEAVMPEDHSEVQLFTGTKRGLFRYQENSWAQLYEGFETNSILGLAQNDQGVYAVSDRGIFFTPKVKAISHDAHDAPASSGSSSTITDSQLKTRFDQEPSVQEVQKFVINYAEVDPAKIQRWRSAAKAKAWLPSLTAGLDRDAGNLYHWDSGANPDALLKGRDNFGWDVSLTWYLEDLIWNPDQTSIDSRSKLMVELRESLLDQVTRLYFERRRLQMELLALPSVPAEIQFEKEMRIAELTALIDGMTGGKFSQRLGALEMDD